MAFAINKKGYWENENIAGHCFDASLSQMLAVYLSTRHWISILDFGCGPGWYVKSLKNVGFDITGYDGNPFTESISKKILDDGTQCGILDLTKIIRFKQQYDCVISLEVGEHIPKEYEKNFFDNLVNNTIGGIILSWAIEGQPGDGHVNCRNNDYIIAEMLKRGFREDKNAKLKLRSLAKFPWFKDTIMVFERIR